MCFGFVGGQYWESARNHFGFVFWMAWDLFGICVRNVCCCCYFGGQEKLCLKNWRASVITPAYPGRWKKGQNDGNPCAYSEKPTSRRKFLGFPIFLHGFRIFPHILSGVLMFSRRSPLLITLLTLLVPKHAIIACHHNISS